MAYKTSKDHRVTWYVWAWNGQRAEKMRHTSTMRGKWGWDAECSCGWKSATGGATKRSVEDGYHGLWWHKHLDPDGPKYAIPGSREYVYNPSRRSRADIERADLIARLEAQEGAE